MEQVQAKELIILVCGVFAVIALCFGLLIRMFNKPSNYIPPNSVGQMSAQVTKQKHVLNMNESYFADCDHHPQDWHEIFIQQELLRPTRMLDAHKDSESPSKRTTGGQVSDGPNYDPNRGWH